MDKEYLARILFQRIDKHGPESYSGLGRCWIWTGCLDKAGYGEICVKGGQRWRAHRLSYLLHSGELEPGKHICHRCDNPTCVNPGHLWQGTSAENTEDMVLKNRQAHKVVPKTLRYIKEQSQAGVLDKDIAKELGVARETVSKYARLAGLYRNLRQDDKDLIISLHKSGLKGHEIADKLGRERSTITKFLKRSGLT